MTIKSQLVISIFSSFFIVDCFIIPFVSFHSSFCINTMSLSLLYALIQAQGTQHSESMWKKSATTTTKPRKILDSLVLWAQHAKQTEWIDEKKRKKIQIPHPKVYVCVRKMLENMQTLITFWGLFFSDMFHQLVFYIIRIYVLHKHVCIPWNMQAESTGILMLCDESIKW